MSWDESDWNHTLLGATRSLIALRARHPALRHGNFQPLASFNGVCVYTMEMGEDAVIVVVNPREAVRDLTIPLQTHGVNWSEVFTGKKLEARHGALQIEVVPARSAMVFVAGE